MNHPTANEQNGRIHLVYRGEIVVLNTDDFSV